MNSLGGIPCGEGEDGAPPNNLQRCKRGEIHRWGADRIRIVVEDAGVGLAPENLTRIFSHGFTTKRDGHGFGLHSGANTARQLGGSLWAESKGLGCGATFILELPLNPSETAKEAASETAKETVRETAGKAMAV